MRQKGRNKELHIYVDADACPVTRIAEQLARKYRLPCTLLCDTSHQLLSDYSEVKVIGQGSDAVDYALLNLCRAGDAVVTQDYGLAAMVLGRGACAMHQSGMEYTEDNIDALLMERHLAARARRGKSRQHLKGPAARTDADDRRFAAAFESMLLRMRQEQKEGEA